MNKKDKLELSNLSEIINFIQSSKVILKWSDVVNFCIDYQNYRELVYYYPIIQRLLIEKNLELKQ